MTLVLLFNRMRSGFASMGTQLLSARRARKVARRAEKILEDRRKRRQKWERPVREFLTGVQAQLPKELPAPAIAPSLVITPRSTAALSEVLRVRSVAPSLAVIEALIADAYALALQQQTKEAMMQQRAAALEYLAALEQMRTMEREEDDLMLFAIAAAV
jgi:hypothetical protein